MPCDTPPPPPSLIEGEDPVEEDLDENMYDFVEEIEILDVESDDSIVTFTGHKDSVFCCNFDPTGQYAASGGQDNTAFVWDAVIGTIKFECTGHSESVIAVDFSPDSKYVATADMNGLVQVRDVESSEQIWSFECEEVAWMEWLHKENILVAGTTDGNCWKWNIPDGDTNMFPTYGFGSTAGCLSSNDEKIAIGYSDGTLKLCNLSNNSVAGTVSGPTGHKSSITSIKYHPDSSLVLSGSEDGTAKLITTSNYKVIWSINCCDAQHGHEDVSVESVEFSISQSLIIIGSNCGQLSFWDISTQTKRFSCSLESFFQTAIVKLIYDESSLLVFVGTAEGLIQAYDVRTGALKHSWDGHNAAILAMTLSRDHKYILASSDDATCKIFVQPNS